MSTPDSSAAVADGARAARRPRALLVAAWLVATVLAAGIAWWAVTAVGGERTGDGTALVSQSQVEDMLAEQGTRGDVVGGGDGSDGAAGAGGSGDDGPGGAGAGTADGTGAETGTEDTEGAGPTPSPSAAPAGPVAPGEPSAQPGSEAAPPPAPAPAAEVARTWDLTGGRVAAVCRGATIGLLGATPAGGWRVEVERAGPQELEVDFSRDDTDSRVRAECVAGTPELTRSGGDDDGDDDRGGGGGGDDDNGGDGNGRDDD